MLILNYCMTWLVLFILWLSTTWLVYPNYEWSIWDLQERQTIMADELQRNYEEEQKDIIIEDYFLFTERIKKIRYAYWCAWWKEWLWCSSSMFDCSWLMEAYWVIKWIIGKAIYNSKSLYEMWDKKNPIMAERWDFTYRVSDSLTWSYKTHFAIVSRDYSWWNFLWVYDNNNWLYKNVIWERALRVRYNSKYFSYARYRIYISSNWFVKKAREEQISVNKWQSVDTWTQTKIETKTQTNNNPLWFSVTVKWFAYDSDANRIASYRYNNWWTKYMIAKFFAESSFNVNALGKEWEKWLCQLQQNRTNLVRINNPLWKQWWEYQAKVCLDKRNAVPEKNRDSIRRASSYSRINDITIMNTK